MMKRTLIAWITLGLLLCPMAAVAADYSLQSGFFYQSWSSDEDESGSQLYVPLKFRSDYDQLSWSVTAGYAATKGDLGDGDELLVNGMLDTQAGITYLLPDLGGLDWLLGLDVNLPTGMTGQKESKVRMMIDPDLFAIVSPGQGLNINPTVSVARRFDQWTVGAGLGYAFQGEYDYSDQTPKYDPGDIFSMALQADYAFAGIWRLNLQAQYLTIGTDKVQGEDFLKKGDAWLLGTALQRSVEKWDMALSVQGLFRGKAEVLDTNGALATETYDSQGDEWIVDLRGHYRWRPRTSFSAGLGYLDVAENGYASTSPYYMGSRSKVSLSIGWLQQLDDTLNLQCTLGGFRMYDDPNWLHRDGDRVYTGWNLTTTLTKTF